jgi:hypothetical protein
MAHESNSPYVKWHIDEFKQVQNSIYKISGWIFHQNRKIKNILIEDSILTYQRISRPDVSQTYPYIVDNNVGFELLIEEKNLYKVLSIIFEDNTGIVNIGNFKDFTAKFTNFHSIINSKPLTEDYILNSGFNNLHKGVMVVDNFYKDPDAIREYAMNNLTFSPSGYHKGERSQERFILNGTKERFEQIIGRKVTNWEHPEYANGRFQFCVDGDPIVYHVDNQTFAAVVFLSPNAPLEAGTATYRSKITGATRFEEFDTPEFVTTFKGYGDEISFYDGSSFEVVDRVGNVYNRLVIWDAKTIHAATKYYGSNIQNSRFFQLFFFDVE